jgi:hypothetical protein
LQLQDERRPPAKLAPVAPGRVVHLGVGVGLASGRQFQANPIAGHYVAPTQFERAQSHR